MVSPGCGISRKDKDQLFLHNQIILYGFDPIDATGDFPRFIDGVFGINGATQLDNPPVGFDTDME